MYALKTISEDLDQFAETIKSILGAEVLIVDDEFVRLVSTETSKQYAKIDQQSVFAHALTHNKAFIIEHPRVDDMCLDCSDRNSCTEYALACAPISIDGAAVGVIGLIAFTALEKNALMMKKEELLNFLNHIAKLIAIKLVEKQKTLHIEMMANELHFIFEAIEKPMISCDAMGKIVRYNQASLIYFKTESALQKNVAQLLQVSCKIKSLPLHKNLRYALDNEGEILTGTYRRYGEQTHENAQFVFVLEDSKSILGMYQAVQSYAKPVKLEDLVGNHPLFTDAIDRATRGAQTDLSIMILGESGTGKELFARGIHHASDRQFAPFIAINCAAIPEHLLEAELFGYEEGAFTGASKSGRAGKFELANGGTLFLDEIGDMPLSLQAKLLRVLQDGYITRVGAHFGHHVNVRIISATHQNLKDKITLGTFRKDLYYRISTFPIDIPTLRERRTDIPQLVRFFIHKYRPNDSEQIAKISPEAMTIMSTYDWDGNVRELENAVAYALSFGVNQGIEVRNLPRHLMCNEEMPKCVMSKDVLFKEAIQKYGTGSKGLEKVQGLLSISRATVYRRLKNLKK